MQNNTFREGHGSETPFTATSDIVLHITLQTISLQLSDMNKVSVMLLIN